MNTVKKTLAFAAALLASPAFALPSVTDVSFVQADDGDVTVSYTLSGAPAIVTGGFLTNGVSVGDAAFTTLYGDVNRLVETDGAHSFKWLPWRDMPGVKIDEAACRATVTAWTRDEPPDMIVINLASNPACRVSYYPSIEALPGGILSNVAYRTMLLPLKRVRAKNRVFTFGTPAGVPDRTAAEAYRTVTFAEDWWMGVFPLTQSQMNYIKCTSGRSSFYQVCGDTRPVAGTGTGELREGSVVCESSFHDAAYRYPHSPHPDSFSGRVHTLSGLWLEPPSDAQWQYTCLAGLEYGWMGHAVTNSTNDAHYLNLGRCKWNGGWMDDGNGNLSAPASNGDVPPWKGGTAECGSYPPNPWGFYDFYGNVNELVLDEADWYSKATSGQDPHGEPHRDSRWDTDEDRRQNIVNKLGNWNEGCGHGQGSYGAGGVKPNNQYVGVRLVWRASQESKYTDLQGGQNNE